MDFIQNEFRLFRFGRFRIRMCLVYLIIQFCFFIESIKFVFSIFQVQQHFISDFMDFLILQFQTLSIRKLVFVLTAFGFRFQIYRSCKGCDFNLHDFVERFTTFNFRLYGNFKISNFKIYGFNKLSFPC